MSFEEIKNIIIDKLGVDAIVKEDITSVQSQLTIRKEKLIEVCNELRSNNKLFFDMLSCLTAIDNGPAKGSMEVLYHLYSIPFNQYLVLRVELERSSDILPSLPTISLIWKTADWHEREAFDLFGINFEGHPDLRRILLPADWEGFPLRKDYQQQEYYHGIKVKY